jgi:uncharacterized protein (DUF58 family)
MRRSTAALVLGLGALAGVSLFGTRPLLPVGLGLVVAGLAARGWRTYVRRRAHVSRTVPVERPLEGSTVRIVYRVEGVRSRLLGPSLAREAVDGLGALEASLEDNQGTLELRRAARGRYCVSDAEVVLEDHLGLEQVVVEPASAEPLLVYPRLPDLHDLFTDGARRGGGQRYVPRRAGGFDFHSVREYEEGESLHKVHWPTTARLGRLMVKDLREAPRDDVVVVLQCERATVVGPRGDSSFDAQVRVAGALLRALVGRGRRAAFVLGTRRPEMFRVTSLEGDWDAVYAALAAVEPDSELALDRLLADPAAVKPAGELMLVAASLGPRVVERLLGGGLRRAAVVLVEPASYGPAPANETPDAGLLRLAAAGIPVAVVRRGDDLADVLGGAQRGRASA